MSLISTNPAQGDYKKVLFACSAGILRSATAAHIFASEPYNWNTRNAGTEEYALIPVTFELLEWAQEIYVMEPEHYQKIVERFEGFCKDKITVLHLQDVYKYRSPALVHLLKRKMKELENKNRTQVVGSPSGEP